jgi:hypothetical protein
MLPNNIWNAFYLFFSIIASAVAPHAYSGDLPARKVFAHYMVCCPTSGPDATLEDFKSEILAAQRYGIDGFSLNSGGWDKQEPLYKKRTALLYEAARQLNTGFLLFISIDFCCGNGEGELRDAIRSFGKHPNQLLYRGEPVISTFAGQGETPKVGESLIRAVHEERGVIVPFFHPHSYNEIPTVKDVEQLINDYTGVDGYFYFGAAGLPWQLAQSNKLHASKWLKAGKLFMASVTPYFRGTGNARRLFDSKGFEGMALQWESAIESGATWIQIVTWNDFSEATYVLPQDTLGATKTHNKIWEDLTNWGQLTSHGAYLEASRYFIYWYKNGHPPHVIDENIYLFYRPEPKLPIGKRGAPENRLPYSGMDQLKDEIYLTAILSEPAVLSIQIGTKQYRTEINAGMQHVTVPYTTGTPLFRLERQGKTVFDGSGEMEIRDRDGVTFYNYFTDSLKRP